MKNRILLTALFLALAFCTVRNANAQPGSLDNTFGTGGKVTTAIGSSWDYGYSADIQSDGKIVMTGYSYNGTDDDFTLARYNNDGTLDNTFGTGGKAIIDFGGDNDESFSVAIQSDGKIVMAGRSYNGTDADIALARYNTDGSLDNTFDSDGKVTTDLGSTYDYGWSVVIQSDGKIVVAGQSNNGIDDVFALVRYNGDGSLDNTFGSGGIVTTDFGGFDAYGYSAVIQSDSKIVVLGGRVGDFALVRYNSDGTLDNTFGSGGKVTTSIGSIGDYGRSVRVQTDGKIVAGGFTTTGSYDDFALIRYNNDGNLDNSFGTAGKVITDFGGYDDWGYSVAIQSNSKIVIAGYSNNGSNDDFAMVRYNADGTLDNTFGSGGKVTTAIGSGDDDGFSVSIQSDGKIIIAGKSRNGSPNWDDFAVVRYNGDPVGISEESIGDNFYVNIFPNPFSSLATIQYNLPATAQVNFTLYNLYGQRVGEILSQKQSAGEHTLTLNAEELNIPNGVYILEFRFQGNGYPSGERRQYQKIVCVR